MQFSQVVKRNILFISQHIKYLSNQTIREKNDLQMMWRGDINIVYVIESAAYGVVKKTRTSEVRASEGVRPVSTLANHKEYRQCIVFNQSKLDWRKYMKLTKSAGKRARANNNWFWFHFWLVEKTARGFLNQSLTSVISSIFACVYVHNSH